MAILGCFLGFGDKNVHFLAFKAYKAYDFLKIFFIWKPLVTKASACSEPTSLNNFVTQIATFCNQELET